MKPFLPYFKCLFLVLIVLISNPNIFSAALKTSLASDWKIALLPDAPSLRSSSVAFGNIWVAGTKSKIFKSEDNGQSWQDISLSDGFVGDIRDIEVFGADTAIIMTVGEGNNSRLYKTTDSGKHWQLLLSNPDKKGFFDSIDFWDNQNGLLLGDPVDDFYVVMTTSDGGKNWQRIGRQSLPKLLKNEAAFAASGNTLMTSSNHRAWITTGGFNASVYYSDDSGKNWTRSSVPLHIKTQTSGGYALAENTNQDIFVLGGDYQDRPGKYNNIARLRINSMLGNWQQIDAGKRGLRTAMTCLQKLCLMTGKTGTDISFDDGDSWQIFSNEGFYTLASDNNVFVAAGHEGRVAILVINQTQ